MVKLLRKKKKRSNTMPSASFINNKSVTTNPKALILYLDYHRVECYIPHLSLKKSISKFKASAELIPTLKEFLPSLKELDYIGVTQGPGPFTTLRTVLSTANGLSFASKIPLVGIDTLEALCQETQSSTSPILIVYNAFCDDVYYLFHATKTKISQRGCMKIRELLQFLDDAYPHEKIIVNGNGYQIHKNLFDANKRFVAASPLQDYASLEEVFKNAQHNFLANKVYTQLLPLYLKQHPT